MYWLVFVVLISVVWISVDRFLIGRRILGGLINNVRCPMVVSGEDDEEDLKESRSEVK